MHNKTDILCLFLHTGIVKNCSAYVFGLDKKENSPKMPRKKGALFFPASGVIGLPWPYTSRYLPKTWRGFIFGPYAHFLIMKFFSKNLKFFFDFLKIQRGDPVDFKKSKKNFKFFEKNFIIKKCAYGPKMKPRQVLGKYFEVYGQAD